MDDGRRYAKCVRCGLEWNVSYTLDLEGKVYICPNCTCSIKDRRKYWIHEQEAPAAKANAHNKDGVSHHGKKQMAEDHHGRPSGTGG